MTKIEWTDVTWNPVVGCSIVSPGCTNCYAMRMAARIEAMDAKTGHAPHYRGLTQPSKAGPVWTGLARLAPREILTAPLRWRRPRRVFVNSMSDLFHEALTDEEIDKVFAVMALSPHCTFQVLTKRAGRMREYFADPDTREGLISGAMDRLAPKEWHSREFWDYHDALPMKHVWLGVSAERQQEADERIPELLATPAAVRFLSAEPLLGPLSLTELAGNGYSIDALSGHHWVLGNGETVEIATTGKLDWVIVGGESGPGSRPMHPDWVRTIRNDCDFADVPFFFKQWGEWGPGTEFAADSSARQAYRGEIQTLLREGRPELKLCIPTRDDDALGPPLTLYRYGKKVAGAQLDGRLHREWPA